MPDRRSYIITKAKLQAKELFRTAKALVLPDFNFGVPTFAYEGGGSDVSSSRAVGPSTDHLSLFDTGPAPKKGTPSRDLMDWKVSIPVLEANDTRDPQALQMDYVEAQRAVSEILKDPRAVHPYITAEAAKMYNSDALVRKHLWHLVVGALAEDYAFMPGESLRDISGNANKRIQRHPDCNHQGLDLVHS
jgi:hypothetical protein